MEHLPAYFCHENSQPHANELQHVVAHTAVATVRLWVIFVLVVAIKVVTFMVHVSK